MKYEIESRIEEEKLNSKYPDSVNKNIPIYQTKNVYHLMSVAFEGMPDSSEIRPMMEVVLKKYNIKATDENRNRVGSALISLRKLSLVGVTEMDILKHVYQHGASNLTFAEQAGLSATLLEMAKQ